MIWYTVAAIIGILLFQQFWSSYSQIETIAYSEFERLLDQGKSSDVTVGTDTIQGSVKAPLPSGKSEFFAIRVDPQLADKLAKHGVVVKGAPSGGLIQTILSWVVPAIIFYVIWMIVFRRFAEKQGIGGLMAVGKSRAKVYVETDTKVTFKDVAGVEEAKFELEEVVAFLRDPKAYGRLGARVSTRLTCAVAVGLNRFNDAGEMLFGRRVCYFGSHGRVAASRANEFLVKGPKIDLLFGLTTRAAIGYTRADFIFDDDAEQPAITGVDGRDF